LVILEADWAPGSVKGRPTAGAVHLEPEYMTAVGIILAIVPLGRMRSRDINDVPITRGALGIEFPMTGQEHDLVGPGYETILGDDGVARFAPSSNTATQRRSALETGGQAIPLNDSRFLLAWPSNWNPAPALQIGPSGPIVGGDAAIAL
jgi:hypothetical protein